MFGVLISLPKHPTSEKPRSSATITRKLGRLAMFISSKLSSSRCRAQYCICAAVDERKQATIYPGCVKVLGPSTPHYHGVHSDDDSWPGTHEFRAGLRSTKWHRFCSVLLVLRGCTYRCTYRSIPSGGQMGSTPVCLPVPALQVAGTVRLTQHIMYITRTNSKRAMMMRGESCDV